MLRELHFILLHIYKDSKEWPYESLDSKGCVYECQKEQNLHSKVLVQ